MQIIYSKIIFIIHSCLRTIKDKINIKENINVYF